MDGIMQKRALKLPIDLDCNKTVPIINFLKTSQKAGSCFDMEFVNEKGYYYRSAFSRQKSGTGKDPKQTLPDTQDVYCEIKVVIAQIKPI